MKKEKAVSFHVDIDSPSTLLKFWGLEGRGYTDELLNRFYSVAMKRALDLFNECGVQVTFFCVGNELERCPGARQMIKNAFASGHEIANHTYSHPLGLSRLNADQIRREIDSCSRIIEVITGRRPVGFRSPGYDINNKVMDILEDLGFEYDSSGFWSSVNIAIKFYHSHFCKKDNVNSGFGESSWRLPFDPYYASRNNWQKPATHEGIIEIPVTRTKILQMPFYSNFHLMMPGLYRNAAVTFINRDYFTYLMHLIEFVDFDDSIPEELKSHPNLNKNSGFKLKIIKDIIRKIAKRYRTIRTDMFADEFSGAKKGITKYVIRAGRQG